MRHIHALDLIQIIPLNPSVFGMNDLPRAKVFYLAIGWWEHADHSAGAPVDEPLLPFADDIIRFAGASEQ